MGLCLRLVAWRPLISFVKHTRQNSARNWLQPLLTSLDDELIVFDVVFSFLMYNLYTERKIHSLFRILLKTKTFCYPITAVAKGLDRHDNVGITKVYICLSVPLTFEFVAFSKIVPHDNLLRFCLFSLFSSWCY